MSRIAKALIPVVLLALGLASCDTESFAPRQGVEIAVDSAAYHLRSMSGGVWYEINMTATVANRSDATVYLSQDCGAWGLRRADDDPTWLILGEYGCAEGVRPQPLAIAAGDSYSKTFRITGSNSPDTRPRITIENNTGTLVFRYAFTNPDGTEWVNVRSAPFEVVPPG